MTEYIRLGEEGARELRVRRHNWFTAMKHYLQRKSQKDKLERTGKLHRVTTEEQK